MARPWERPQFGVDGRPLKPTVPSERAAGGGSSPYRLGKAFERSVMDQLKRRGYFVLRAGASKGKIDVLAVARDRPVLFIQCKRTGNIGSSEWNEVWEIAQAHGGWAIVTMRLSPRTTGYFRIDAPRVPRRPGRPWTQLDTKTLDPLPDQERLIA